MLCREDICVLFEGLDYFFQLLLAGTSLLVSFPDVFGHFLEACQLLVGLEERLAQSLLDLGVARNGGIFGFDFLVLLLDLPVEFVDFATLSLCRLLAFCLIVLELPVGFAHSVVPFLNLIVGLADLSLQVCDGGL